jgi:hypothetical protein
MYVLLSRGMAGAFVGFLKAENAWNTRFQSKIA